MVGEESLYEYVGSSRQSSRRNSRDAVAGDEETGK